MQLTNPVCSCSQRNLIQTEVEAVEEGVVDVEEAEAAEEVEDEVRYNI